MSQTYQVNYIVNVDATKAQTAVNSFKRAIASMNQATKPLIDLQNKVRGLVETMSALNRSSYTVKIDTRPATQQIGKLIRGLKMAQAEIQKLNAMGVRLAAAPSSRTTSARAVAPVAAPVPIAATAKASSSRHTTSRAVAPYSRTNMPRPYAGSSNIAYKALGPTPLPNNGGMAIDMLKGMGIAYGIAGFGTLISNVIEQSTDYNNIMTTVDNILKSHDPKGNFDGRSGAMKRTVRDVGMKTKFKVTEVAEAAKFLAMAGLDIEAIQNSIRPIADIALVGDTDLGQTADLVTNIMTAYNIEPSKMRNAADVMTNTFTRSNTTLTEIAESYKYAASLLSAGDVPFEEATAAIGVLGDAGIKGSQAGTTLRTIMANIVNPTKKQRAAWENIGIKLTDKYGNRKDLLDIFQELNNADLDVDAFYKLFHKTAASGAVALAKHVEKWEQVYLENFNATGLTSKLAYEKQNTIQGLWAQLTSVFTDQGVTAFSSIQGMIKGYLKSAINWLNPEKNPGAQETFKKIAYALMEFVDTLKEASKWFFWFFDHFGWFIKHWVKFQLMIWPVVKAITAVKSVFIGLLALKRVVTVISGLAGAFRLLGRSTAAAAVAGQSFNGIAAAGLAVSKSPYGIAAGTALLPALTTQQYAKAVGKLKLARPHYDASLTAAENQAILNSYKQQRRVFNKRVLGMQMRNGLGMGLGAVGLMAGMSQMTSENANSDDMLSGGLFGAAGMAAMAGGPIGWGVGAALAAVGVWRAWEGAKQHAADAHAAIEAYTSQHQVLDGVITNSSSRTERYLETVWRKNYDINDLIRRRIELLKEELGLESPKETTSQDIDTESYHDWLKKFKDTDHFYDSGTMAQEAADALNQYGAQYGISISKKDGHWTLSTPYAPDIIYNDPNNLSDEQDVVAYDVAAALGMFTGEYRRKLIEENQGRLANFLYSNSTAADVRKWQGNFLDQYGPSSWIGKERPNELQMSYEDAAKRDGDQLGKSWLASVLTWAATDNMRKGQQAIIDFKTQQEKGTLIEGDVIEALRWGDNKILGATLRNYDPRDITGWFKSLGYDNGRWTDPNGVESGEHMAKMAAYQLQYMLDAIKKLGPDAVEVTDGLREYVTLLLNLTDAGIGVNGSRTGKKDEILIVEGQKWKWDESAQLWRLLGEDGKVVKIRASIMQLSDSLDTLSSSLQTLNNTPLPSFPTLDGQWQSPIGSGFPVPPLVPNNDIKLVPNSNGYGFHIEPVEQPKSAAPKFWKDGAEPFFVQSNATTSQTPAPQIPQNNSLIPYWQRYGGGFQYNLPQWTTQETQQDVVMGPEAMANKLQNSKAGNKKNGANNPFDSNNNDNNPFGTSTADYKPSSRERAVPKQININIQNLMNVDKVDLANPEKAATVERLKREVAYALVEAASDGTIMLNNLV